MTDRPTNNSTITLDTKASEQPAEYERVGQSAVVSRLNETVNSEQ